MNKVIIIGNVGSDPVTRKLDWGTVCEFSVATSENYKNKAGEKVFLTEWHNVSMTGKLAEIADQWVKKGSQVAVEGKIKTDSWEDNGVKKYKTKIVVDFSGSLKLLGQKESTNSSVGSGSIESPVDENLDDLPF
jgi:single-strand DNA-binding protein